MRIRQPQLNILTLAAIQKQDKSIKDSGLTLFITPEAMDDLADVFSVLPAEGGLFGYGPKDKDGMDVLEPDVRGSTTATGVSYSPYTPYFNRHAEWWLNRAEAEVRVEHGIIHSHPGNSGFPSGRMGERRGDLAYGQALLENQPWMASWFIPIVTGVDCTPYTRHAF